MEGGRRGREELEERGRGVRRHERGKEGVRTVGRKGEKGGGWRIGRKGCSGACVYEIPGHVIPSLSFLAMPQLPLGFPLVQLQPCTAS